LTERITFNLTAEDLDTSFQLPAEGWHDVVIDDAEFEESNRNGNPQYLLKYKSTNDSFKGTQWDWITVTQKAIQNIMSVSRAIGDKVPTKAEPGEYTLPDVDDLIGKELQIKIEHAPDRNGKEDDDGNVITRASVAYGFSGRKKIGEKTGVPASKGGGKATSSKKADAVGFAV
jgi:hypothetical protein